MKDSLVTVAHTRDRDAFDLHDLLREPQPDPRVRRSALLNGLTRRQRTFVMEKLTGLNDKDAAIVAGHSVSVAENTKQRIWKAKVRAEYERLERPIIRSLSGRASLLRAAS